MTALLLPTALSSQAPLGLVVSGPVGAGKTTFVQTLSQTPVVATEASEDIGKTNTTVAFDFGTLHLGEDGAAVVFTRAGEVRGRDLAAELGVAGSNVPVEQIAGLLNAAIGAEGTCLAAVTQAYREGDTGVIETQDTACSAGEPMGSTRRCTFTLGAVWGALEAITGQTSLGEHTGSVLRGEAPTSSSSPRSDPARPASAPHLGTLIVGLPLPQTPPAP